jgi:hypothetical protein
MKTSQLHQRLVEIARAAQVVEGRKSLLGDGVRVLTRTMT